MSAFRFIYMGGRQDKSGYGADKCLLTDLLMLSLLLSRSLVYRRLYCLGFPFYGHWLRVYLAFLHHYWQGLFVVFDGQLAFSQLLIEY